jgi:TRAP-type C4-dicarboxylate transport system substrate-binding protein
MRVLAQLGLYQNNDEVAYIAEHLRPQFDGELERAGFVYLGLASIGTDLVFSRRPITRLEDLRSTRMWIWELDQVSSRGWSELGVPIAKMTITDAARAYERGEVDGFFAVPTAALAFQWSSLARYLTYLPWGYTQACSIIASQSLANLPSDAQALFKSEMARGMQMLDAVGRAQEGELLGGLFERQGLHAVPASDEMRRQFFTAATAARMRMTDGVVDPALVQRVVALLAQLRARERAAKEHH